MRDDEEIAFRTTSKDLSYTVWYQAMQDVHAPVWFSSFWLWQQFVGTNEFTARVYSVLATTITLALVYQIGRTWFKSSRVGLFAIAVLGVNAYFFTYALEIRPYAVNMLIATLSMWCFGRWLKRCTFATALVYGLTVAWMLYQHYFLMFLVAAQFLYLLFIVRPSFKMLQQIAAAWLLAFLLWSPWFPILIHQIRTLIAIESSFGNARGAAGIGSTTESTTITGVVSLLNLMTSGQPGLYLLLFAVGFIYSGRQKRYWLILMWALAVPLVALLVNFVFSVYTPRYITYLSIGFALAIAVGFSVLPRRIQWLGLVAFAAVSLWSLPSQFGLNRIPHRAIYQDIAQSAQAGDVMLLDNADMENNVVLWQMMHYIPSSITFTRDINQAQTARRIWFTTADWFDEAVQVDFKHLEPDYPVQRVLGDCNRYWCYLVQLMVAPPFKTPVVFGEQMPFWGADVEAVTHDTVDVHLWWRAAQPPKQNYSIGLHLLDAAGNLVAQIDGPISHYGHESVDTAAMQPDKIYIDYRTLNLPDSITAGDYQLELIVYDWQTGERLLLADGNDHLVIEQVQVP